MLARGVRALKRTESAQDVSLGRLFCSARSARVARGTGSSGCRIHDEIRDRPKPHLVRRLSVQWRTGQILATRERAIRLSVQNVTAVRRDGDPERLPVPSYLTCERGTSTHSSDDNAAEPSSEQ